MSAQCKDPVSTDGLIETVAQVAERCANVARFGSEKYRYRIACEFACIEEALKTIEPIIEAEARKTIAELKRPLALPPARRAS